MCKSRVSDFDLEAGLHNLLLPSSAVRDNLGQGTRVNVGVDVHIKKKRVKMAREGGRLGGKTVDPT